MDALKALIKDSHKKTIVLGDYNQRIPRKWSPKTAYEKLLETFEPNFTVSTTGIIKEMDKQAIDYFPHTYDIEVKSITAIGKI